MRCFRLLPLGLTQIDTILARFPSNCWQTDKWRPVQSRANVTYHIGGSEMELALPLPFTHLSLALQPLSKDMGPGFP